MTFGVRDLPAVRAFYEALGWESRSADDHAIEVVREAGGRVLAEPAAREWGGRSAYFADPEGNTCEVAWLPGSTFDARGGLIWP